MRIVTEGILNLSIFKGERWRKENRILLPVLGMFLLSIAAPAWKNIQKLGVCDEQGGSAPEKEAGERAQ